MVGTLESGINVAPWINIAPGKFGKKNKRSPIYNLYLYYWNRLYELQNKAVAPKVVPDGWAVIVTAQPSGTTLVAPGKKSKK